LRLSSFDLIRGSGGSGVRRREETAGWGVRRRESNEMEEDDDLVGTWGPVGSGLTIV
jgi:hypothetical protein